MAEKRPERRSILDPAVADLLGNMEQRRSESQLPRREREKKVREREKIRARREARATYDLPPDVRQRMKELGDLEGVPASQLVTLALLNFLLDYNQGRVDLSTYRQPSRSPRYDWNLALPEELYQAALKVKRRGGGIKGRP